MTGYKMVTMNVISMHGQTLQVIDHALIRYFFESAVCGAISFYRFHPES